MRNPTGKLAILAGLVVLAVAAWVPWSRYTDLGIFVGGGGRYWVQRAAASRTDDEAVSCLRRVVAATQYGVNVAENQVAAIPDRQIRMRLWRILVQVAPNENWHGIYSRRLAHDQSPSPSGG